VVMMNRLRQTLEQFCQLALADGDGSLLGRFLATRDEAAFAALVRRHGPMVWGVCRRVLRHEQDAEDAFQATFLVLARKARSVVKRDSLGSWLYSVAYHLALKARAVGARRRAHETQVDEIPHPEVAAPEPRDWLPTLDRELERLPEKYRAAVVLCELEGLPRREAARQLGLPEGTLSSRLATARRLLAKRLARCGFSLPGGALALALGEGVVRAVPAPLVEATVHAAAGRVTVSAPVSLLIKGVFNLMFLKKLKLMLGIVMLVGVLGATGLAYRAGAQAPPTDRLVPAKPPSELEALRKENELLRLNLLVVLEKVRSQEEELRAFRGKGSTAKETERADVFLNLRKFQPTPKVDLFKNEYLRQYEKARKKAPTADTVKMVEEALKALKASSDAEGQRRAAEALERALRNLKEHPKQP